MKKTSLLLLVAISFLIACGPKINNTQQKQLATLTNQVDSINVLVNSLDSASIDAMISNFFEKKNFFQKDMKDTLDVETLFKLDEYIQLKKGMSFIKNQFTMIKSESNIMQQQLVDLNLDVSNRLIDEAKFEKYYQLEKKNYDQLNEAANRLVTVTRKVEEDYNKMSPLADSLMNAYMAKQNE